MDIKIHNRFDFVLKDGKTGKVKSKATAFNVVTNYYYERIAAWDATINYIHLGTGSGTPAVTDTSLFQFLGSGAATSSEFIFPTEPDLNARVLHFHFTESQVVGLLTEVGLTHGGSSAHGLWTHALITDSENQPMTIDKKDTDTLDVTATIYSKITVTPPFRLFRFGIGTDWITQLDASTPPPDRGVAYGPLVRNTLGAPRTYNTISYFPTSLPVGYQIDRSVPTNTIAVSAPRSTITGGYRFTGNRVLAAEQNLGKTAQIKSIMPYDGFFLTFPNHTLFPPKEVVFELSGDGTTTDFNLGFSELMTGDTNVSVTVGGTQLTYGVDYDWYGKDYTIPQTWPSSDLRYVRDDLTWVSFGNWPYNTSVFPQCFGLCPFNQDGSSFYLTVDPNPTVSHGKVPQIVFDFQNPITVSAVKDQGRAASLYYSSDLENWTKAASVSGSVYETSFSPISARYWKWAADSSISFQTGQYPLPQSTINNLWILAFGDPKPQIHFHTAPAQNAIIQIRAKTEYPVKNDKWLLDNCVIDYFVERDDS